MSSEAEILHDARVLADKIKKLLNRGELKAAGLDSIIARIEGGDYPIDLTKE